MGRESLPTLNDRLPTFPSCLTVAHNGLVLCRGARCRPGNRPAPAAFPERRYCMSDKRITVWVQRFKDHPTLMLQWLDPDTGKRKSKSAETADEEKAETARADLEYEL